MSKKVKAGWLPAVKQFLEAVHDPATGGSTSALGGRITLYGTCYAALAKYYISSLEILPDRTSDFLIRYQDPGTGLMIGPELKDFYPEPGVLHNREHLVLHLTCAALPTCQNFNIRLRHPLRAAHQFLDLDFLAAWLARRDLRNAWFEGNNLLFVGQLLVYLRDVKSNAYAQPALDHWFQWLDGNMDHATNLWGTNGYCTKADAVYGGYHQLLLYYHENHPIMNPSGLIDTVLGLQHSDGGFSPVGNAGACEDVDCVDILVNLYKRFDYRRAEIRHRLSLCADHILRTQNPDGGFPYHRDFEQGHMGIPDMKAPANASTTFATWFRIHTLALCAQIIPSHPNLEGIQFRFSKTLSMGWHTSPSGWKLEGNAKQTIRDASSAAYARTLWMKHVGRKKAGKVLRQLGLR